MIRDIVRQAWAQSPGRFLLAVALTPVVVLAGRALLVVTIVGLS